MIPHREVARINKSYKFILHKTGISEEFNSRKDLQPAKLERSVLSIGNAKLQRVLKFKDIWFRYF